MATLHFVSGMATRTLRALAVFLLAISICEAASVFHPFSDSLRSAASELFTQGSFDSLEEAYEALRSFEVLGIDKPDIPGATCESVVEELGSSASAPKNLFYALKVNSIRKGEVKKEVFEGIASRLKAVVNGASSLLDIYYSIGSLVLIKAKVNTVLGSSASPLTVRLVRAFSSDSKDASIIASQIGKLNRDVSKLFDSVEKYDDVAFYFDENVDQSPLPTTASVVRGLTALAAVTSKKLKLAESILDFSVHRVPGEKILGLAKFFLGIGIPGKNKDFFNQTDSLASLESNNVSVALILSLLTTVLSLTKKDQLKAKVNTVLGSSASPLTVRLVRAFSSDSKDASVIASQDLKLDKESGYLVLDVLPKSVNVGSYIFVFGVVLYDSEDETVYTPGGLAQVGVFVTGVINIENAEISVLESDKSVETQKKLDLVGENAVSLSANHLQKLRLSFQLTILLGHAFKRHQDFLGLVDKFYYLSGSYDLQLTVGDAAMENSFLRSIGHVDLDLPEATEMATRLLLSGYISVSLSQSDGRWRYRSDPHSSTYAADDGAFYFDEKVDQSPLSTTASVVRGLTASPAVESEKSKFIGEKILGLANFFLGIGIPAKNKDFFNQTDSLASLESKNVSVARILSLLTTVLSLTKKDQLKICLREPYGLVCWCIVVSEERKVSYVHQQGTVLVVLKVQREHKIITYTDVQKMHSFPVMQMEIATTAKRKAKPPYGGDDKDKVDMGPAVNVYRITTDAVVHEIGQIHPLSYNGDPYGLHNVVLSIVQAHISSGGLFGYATPTFQQFRIVYYHDPHREDGRMIRLNCPELELPYYYFSSLLSGIAICDFDPVQFLVP